MHNCDSLWFKIFPGPGDAYEFSTRGGVCVGVGGGVCGGVGGGVGGGVAGGVVGGDAFHSKA